VGKTRLSPEDWATAALTALADGGLGAVRVEAIAPRLGASKGSFYWHFADRAALVEAALALWEERDADTFLQALAPGADPRARLRALFELVLDDPHAGEVDAALAADAGDPQVAAALERVSRRRVRSLERTFADLGLDRAETRRRALSAYSAYLGFVTLRRQVPGLVPAGRRARRSYVDAQVGLLTEP
jgi:AcrR family transcriptional regulator